jgi:hypothetical protein
MYDISFRERDIYIYIYGYIYIDTKWIYNFWMEITDLFYIDPR